MVGNDSADDDQNVIHLVLSQQIHHAGYDGIVSARENGQADHVNVFLQRGIHDHFRGLPKPCIDNFHASVAEGASDHFGAAIMTVQAGFGHEHPDFLLRHRHHLNTIGVATAEGGY